MRAHPIPRCATRHTPHHPPQAATHSVLRRLPRAFALAAIVSLCGCSTQPWVKPYERQPLADPMMQFSREMLLDKHRTHVYEVREGARGATGVQGGGCGCN